MPIPTYTLGYPPDGSSLGQTKTVIRNNLDGTFETLNVDHVNNNGQPGSNPAGYHTIIHEVTQTSVETVAGVNQVFSGIPGTLVVNSVTTPAIPSNGDTQLYSLTGMGGLAQLTGFSAMDNGYAWMGGILVQWGTDSIASGSHVTDSTTFPIAFPNNCFAVVLTLQAASGGSDSSDNTISITSSSPHKSTFSWIFNGQSGNYPNFFWVAIGN
jgi:hypothetical protein